MGLVLVSIVTGLLSLLGAGDVTARAAPRLSQQQQQFLRQWLAKTQQSNNNNSQPLRVVWQPPPDNQGAVSPPQPKPPRFHGGRQVVLKAGYASAQPEAAPVQQAPAQVSCNIHGVS